RLPLGDPITGFLPAARSTLPSSLAGMPPALPLLNPKVGLTNDSAIGLSQTASIRMDLLSVADVLQRQPREQPSWTVPFVAAGRRGLNEDTYDGLLSIGLGHDAPVAVLQHVDLHADYEASRNPQGDARLDRETVRAGSLISLKPGVGAFHQF